MPCKQCPHCQARDAARTVPTKPVCSYCKSKKNVERVSAHTRPDGFSTLLAWSCYHGQTYYTSITEPEYIWYYNGKRR